MKKLLLLAPYADGTDVGEAWSTYQWVRELSSIFDCTILTQSKSDQSALANQITNAEVIQWTDPPYLKQYPSFLGMAKPYYPLFSHRASRWIAGAIRRGRHWDLAHQISPLALRYPSPLRNFRIPFVIGPLAGSLETPDSFRNDMQGNAWYTKLRVFDQFRLKYDPSLRSTFARAAIVIGVAPYVRDLVPLDLASRFVLCNETAISKLPVLMATPGGEKGPLRLLYVGRIVRPKGLMYLLRAMNRLDGLDVVLDVVGDGIDRMRCEEYAAKSGSAARIRFHGRIPRKDVDEYYRRADVFVLPSIREPSGNVILEAMSFGLPMIVADNGGPAHTVKETFGSRIPLLDPEQFSSGLAGEIAKFASNRAILARMGACAREEAGRMHVWDSRMACLIDIYARLDS